MSILEDNIITKRFLFPRKKDVENPFFINSNGNRLSCMRFMNFDNARMFVVFHAGNELAEDYADVFAREIEQMGLNLLLVEYSGYAMSDGKANILNITDTIPDIIKRCGTPAKDLIIFGRSIGAIYAVDAVDKFPEIRGLILESAPADFYKRIKKRVNADDIDCAEELLKTEVLKYFDNEKKLRKYKGSTLIMHGQDDRIIEPEQAQENYNWANEPKGLQIFEGGTHKGLEPNNKLEYFNTIWEFVKRI